MSQKVFQVPRSGSSRIITVRDLEALSRLLKGGPSRIMRDQLRKVLWNVRDMKKVTFNNL